LQTRVAEIHACNKRKEAKESICDAVRWRITDAGTIKDEPALAPDGQITLTAWLCICHRLCYRHRVQS